MLESEFADERTKFDTVSCHVIPASLNVQPTDTISVGANKIPKNPIRVNHQAERHGTWPGD